MCWSFVQNAQVNKCVKFTVHIDRIVRIQKWKWNEFGLMKSSAWIYTWCVHELLHSFLPLLSLQSRARFNEQMKINSQLRKDIETLHMQRTQFQQLHRKLEKVVDSGLLCIMSWRDAVINTVKRIVHLKWKFAENWLTLSSLLHLIWRNVSGIWKVDPIAARATRVYWHFRLTQEDVSEVHGWYNSRNTVNYEN